MLFGPRKGKTRLPLGKENAGDGFMRKHVVVAKLPRAQRSHKYRPSPVGRLTLLPPAVGGGLAQDLTLPIPIKLYYRSGFTPPGETELNYSSLQVPEVGT